MKFEWDDIKNRQNIEKHGVSFDDACKIFDNFTFDAVDNRFDYGEKRTVSIGIIHKIAILTVVHTDRKGVRRLISARQANKKERERYDTQIQRAFDPARAFCSE
jgi:uncharacterized DUF497 family protein